MLPNYQILWLTANSTWLVPLYFPSRLFYRTYFSPIQLSKTPCTKLQCWQSSTRSRRSLSRAKETRRHQLPPGQDTRMKMSWRTKYYHFLKTRETSWELPQQGSTSILSILLLPPMQWCCWQQTKGCRRWGLYCVRQHKFCINNTVHQIWIGAQESERGWVLEELFLQSRISSAVFWVVQ